MIKSRKRPRPKTKLKKHNHNQPEKNMKTPTWTLLATALLVTACGSGSNLVPVVADDPITEESNPFEVVEAEAAREPEIAVIAEPEIEVVEATPEPVIEVVVPDPVVEQEREIVEGEDPVYSPDPIETVEIPDSVTYDNTMLYQIEMVEVYDNSPTAMFMRTANFTDMGVSNIACRFTAYLDENPVMTLSTIQLFSPDGVAVSLSSGQEQTTRIVLNAEGYTGHHVDRVEWVCNHRFDELGGATRSSGEWVGESVYGVFQ